MPKPFPFFSFPFLFQFYLSLFSPPRDVPSPPFSSLTKEEEEGEGEGSFGIPVTKYDLWPLKAPPPPLPSLLPVPSPLPIRGTDQRDLGDTTFPSFFSPSPIHSANCRRHNKGEKEKREICLLSRVSMFVLLLQRIFVSCPGRTSLVFGTHLFPLHERRPIAPLGTLALALISLS